jgi:diadenosine tetraphosphate (Ap4A) HIT family hydrolase
METVECPFCTHPSDREIIAESAMAFALYDLFPVNPGHALIIPKRHVADYFALDSAEQSDCVALLHRVQALVAERYNPDGFNVGINVGEAAGQTVPHVHIHLIPRYRGDVDEARGGVRGLIPNRRNYP